MATSHRGGGHCDDKVGLNKQRANSEELSGERNTVLRVPSNVRRRHDHSF